MSKKTKVVVLSGAGVSAESGIATFRGSGGLWENMPVEEVASINGWRKNRGLVLGFYNQRRARVAEAQPNAAHLALARLEKQYDVQIITQNVDDLHERGGSTNVLHLHGKITEARSEGDAKLIYPIGYSPIALGDLCEKGYQLRPNIVWFGEEVPLIPVAAQIVQQADIFIVVGTSLAVYPAAGLIDYAPKHARKYIVDPNIEELSISSRHWTSIPTTATVGVVKLVDQLIAESKN